MSALSNLLKYDKNAEEYPYDEFIPVLEQADVNPEKDDVALKKAFEISRNAALKIYDEYKATLDFYKEDNEKAIKKGLEIFVRIKRLPSYLSSIL